MDNLDLDPLRRKQDDVTKIERLQVAIEEGIASPPIRSSIEDIIEQGFARLTLNKDFGISAHYLTD